MCESKDSETKKVEALPNSIAILYISVVCLVLGMIVLNIKVKSVKTNYFEILRDITNLEVSIRDLETKDRKIHVDEFFYYEFYVSGYSTQHVVLKVKDEKLYQQLLMGKKKVQIVDN